MKGIQWLLAALMLICGAPSSICAEETPPPGADLLPQFQIPELKGVFHRGPRGHEGHRGHTGKRGETGTQGPQGKKGRRGYRGSTGPVGPTGAVGPTGMTGPTGSTGTPGAVGATGAAGTVGSTGPTGATGSAGLSGQTTTPFAQLTLESTLGITETGLVVVPFDGSTFSSNSSPALFTYDAANQGIKVLTNGVYAISYSVQVLYDTSTSTVDTPFTISVAVFNGGVPISRSSANILPYTPQGTFTAFGHPAPIAGVLSQGEEIILDLQGGNTVALEVGPLAGGGSVNLPYYFQALPYGAGTEGPSVILSIKRVST